MKHSLSLHIPHTMNTDRLTIVDTSVYTELIDVACPTLQVQLPNFTTATTFNESSYPSIAEGFNVNLTACDLDVQTSGCGTTFNDLPDGIYVIKYSVSPNDIVFVEYNHLRITLAMAKYYAHMCDLDLSDCGIPADKLSKFNMLKDIKGYLDAAVASVEFCRKTTKGMQLYNYALALLNKLDCKTCH